MLDKSTEITEISFDGENSHIALCHKSQGYSANSRHVALLIKAEDMKITPEALQDLEKVAEVKLEISMMEFLQRFMGMYYYDAKKLAFMLGYDVEEDMDEYDPLEYLKRETEGYTLLKSAIAKDIKDTASLADVKKLAEVINKVSFDAPVQVSTSGGDPKPNVEKSTQSPQVDTKQQSKGESMSEVTELEKANIRIVELEKAAAKLVELEKAEQTRIEEGYLNLVKSLSFAEDKDHLALVQAIIKSESLELVTLLEKAKDLVEKGFTKEEGFDGQGVVVVEKSSKEATAEYIKQHYAKV